MTSQLLLFSQPRSGSHLLERMLGKQSNVKLLEHPYSNSRGLQIEWLRSKSYEDGMPSSTRSEFEDEIRKGNRVWQDSLAEVQGNNRILMLHTHAFFPVSPDRILDYIKIANAGKSGTVSGENCTMIPEHLLLHPGTVPVFTIREPRLVVPSAYRTMNAMDIPQGGGRPNYLITTCNIWNRVLYDFYVSHGFKPIVVDADDYMTNEDFVRHLCVQAGFDANQAYLSWPVPTKEEMDKIHPMYYASQSTLINSSGISPARAAKNMDLDKDEKNWQAEFGDDLPLVKEMVELSMPHYQYLFERRLRM